ncbi:nitroreductase family protein [Demequina rhizosphaerae]|uniref:nitroreductase family protein n=1 Tax=Demequina rhizosphaerae TaxID=1638985 RepID=UPI000A07C45C|nr:nitroreductase family protein [Demequina rhizosphaerae]
MNAPALLRQARFAARRVGYWMRVERYRFGQGPFIYRFGSAAFDRENSAVFEGIKEHHRRTRASHEVFEVRRRIHMLEKGFTMTPRRTTYATDYIGELVDRVAHATAENFLDLQTVAWARDVLDGYFEATSLTDSASIIAARARYSEFKLESDHGYSGPLAIGMISPQATYESFESLAHSRRSVRWYEPRRVERDVIDRALHVAVEAPSACNRVPYRFEVFDDPEDARRVAALAGGTAGYLHNLQHVAVVVGDLSAFQAERDRHLIYIDGSLAAMSFIFGLETQGVGSCCINWPDYAESEHKMRALIGLERYERVVMLVAFGYAQEGSLAPQSPKRALSSVRHYRAFDRD